ncbi:CCA tRNA nucleotidyltransferase [Urbifossiella limnaea]|uniref:tRNA nucleotidyltransferase/poly(A) polymerase n=1 Tax=Urbifossiella limnaea TaxID=2528023 RepID=A0A517XRM7_9BACT|nr:CCA tRNA nucleotidyltransferase [Urbifossiella limnaea]QDU20170.1 tRNA nucleotidyltransferase/poly(A) polymerase [Urbifossiella limnaea]
MTEREFAVECVRTLQNAGFRALWAGGCVRDELLGLEPNDYDIATDARPEQVQKLFRRTIAVGAAFGVIEVIGPRDPSRGGEHLTVEVATFRSDGTYSDGRRPDSVVFSSPEEDAARRDFTINGMFFDPIAGQLHDYVGGRADLDSHTLRAIGDPFARFAEDKLRVLRAVRIATRFHFGIDDDTFAAAKAMAPQITVVSPERIADELRKLLTHPNRAVGVWLLRDVGLIEPILPELVPEQPRWDRTAEMMESFRVGPNSFPLIFAALIHTVDRPAAEVIAERLRFSNAEKSRMSWLVENQRVLLDAPTMRPSALKPILVHPGIDELLALHRALARGQVAPHVEFCERVLQDTPREVLDPQPLLTGNDLKALGMRPGPDFKRLLDAVREAQLDGELRTRDDALARVRALSPGSG